MNYEKISQIKQTYNEKKSLIPKETIESFFNAFSIEYTHNSTAIEGNTLTLIQTKTVIEDGISVGGKMLREIYEIVNHEKAFRYINNCIEEDKSLDENIIKEIHAITM